MLFALTPRHQPRWSSLRRDFLPPRAGDRSTTAGRRALESRASFPKRTIAGNVALYNLAEIVEWLAARVEAATLQLDAAVKLLDEGGAL